MDTPVVSAEEVTSQNEPVATETTNTPLAQKEAITIKISDQETQVESTVFDLYLGNEFQGSAVASYTEEWFQLDDPADAVAQFSTLQAHKTKLVDLASGRVPKQRKIPGLGEITYDLDTFRILLKPEPEFLQSKSLDWRQRVGAPEPGVSVQQTMGLVASHDTESATISGATAFTHRGLMSYEDIFLRTNGFITQDQSYQLNEATLGSIVGDYDSRAGMLQMRSQSLTPSLRFLGLQFETSQNIFLENESARGSKLEIFVPSRSTVQFYRDSQLLSVQLLDFGLQEIDTSSFPQGSYEVDIVMTDSTGRETRDKRFFTKAGFLASRAAPVVFFSGGAVRNGMELLSTPLAQGGMRMRASDFFDLGIGVSSTDQRSIGNFDVNGFYDILRFGVGAAASPSGGFGRYGNLGITAYDFSISGRLLRADGEANATNSNNPTPDPNYFIPQRAVGPVDLIIQSQVGKALSVSRSFGALSARYNIQDNRIGDGPQNYARGPTVDYRIYDYGSSNMTSRASYFDTQLGANTSLQLFYRYQISPTFSINSQLLRQWQRDQDELLFLVGISYDSLAFNSGSGSRLRLIEEARRTANSGEQQDIFTSTLQGTAQADYLSVGTFVRDTRTDPGESRSTLGVNAESTVFVSNDGDIDLSRPPVNDAVFVAEVEGNLLSDSDRFDVVVNGQRQGVVTRGERALISLMPYRKYSIGLLAGEGSSLVDYDAASYTVTLFPGNVVKRVWHVDKIFVLLGRLVDEAGEPISSERIRGAKGYGFTEKDGTFQIEISGREKLSVESQRHSCTLDFSTETPPEYLLDAGDIVCRTDEERELQN